MYNPDFQFRSRVRSIPGRSLTVVCALIHLSGHRDFYYAYKLYTVILYAYTPYAFFASSISKFMQKKG